MPRKKRKDVGPLITGALIAGGASGLSPRDISERTPLPSTTVSAWLAAAKKNGTVTQKNYKYIFASGKTSPTPDPTSLILPIIAAAGAKGISFHDIAEQTSLNDNVLGIWLCEHTDKKGSPAVEMKAYDKYILTAQGKVNIKKLKGWVQAGDEIDI